MHVWIETNICRLFGVTTLDVVRASTFVAEINKDCKYFML